jgi:hypothetical protein
VGGFLEVTVNVVICQNSASHRGDTHGFFPDTQLVYGLGYQPVDNAVGATGTIVGVIVC